MECSDHEMVFVKKTTAHNHRRINKQCLSCGEVDSKAYKLDLVRDYSALPDYSEELFEEHLKKRHESWKDEFEKRNQDRVNDIKRQREEWFKNEYEPYLNSHEWRVKRVKVLKRDNFICQACLENKATQVHHLTYKHVFNEPLFELVSVCKQCHDLITNLDQAL